MITFIFIMLQLLGITHMSWWWIVAFIIIDEA